MPRRAPVPLTAEWRARFDQEMTRELLARLMVWTQAKVDRVNRLEGVADHLEARGVVLDACSLTLQGIRRWNPDGARTLEKHLRQTIESRLYHDRRWRRVRRLHRDIDAVDSTDGESPLEAEVSLRAENRALRPDGAVLLASVRAQVVDALRPMIGEDADVAALLDAWLSGCEHRGHVMTRLGWSLNQFRNAERRLATLCARLPAEVLESARALVDDLLPRPWDMTRRRKHRKRSDGKRGAAVAPVAAVTNMDDASSSDSIDAVGWDAEGDDPDALGWDDEVGEAASYEHDGDVGDEEDEP